MERSPTRQRGFTLLEIIIVLAVVSILVAILTPRVIIYIQDANISRAQADVNAIAAAIEKMYKDTARYPFYEVGTSKLAHDGLNDAWVLTSNPACDLASGEHIAGVGGCDTTAPTEELTSETWDLTAATTLADSMAHQLIMNTPAYATTGHKAWKGPYLQRIPDVDPWGRSYLVNIINADPADTTRLWVIVISAGPDGQLDAEQDEGELENPAAFTTLDDDIFAMVR